MKSAVAALIMVGACALTTTEASAWAGSHHSGGAHHEVWYGNGGNGPTASVPEPSSMYALTSGLALLGGAGWYLRRRK